MSSLINIRTKICAIKNMQKITKAMEMIAASKKRKMQERMNKSFPYVDSIQKVINHLHLSSLEYKHLYLEERQPKKAIGYLLISTDRGLCGGMNNNLFRKLLKEIKKWREQEISCDLVIIGTKGVTFFRSVNEAKILAQLPKLGHLPSLTDIIGPIKILLQAYEEKRLDRIYLVYNQFINVISQVPHIMPILPIPIREQNVKKRGDYIYEPESKLLINILLQRYIESQIYQKVLENLMSEQVARMIAMRTATDNIGRMIKEIQLVYNNIRQNTITQELTEIVAGAAAV
ncbi:MAG: F0F1 ATP synthase subunit gamma [Candidatus Dasytiphilus stammeri]